MAIDNTLWGGAVAETKKGDADTEALKVLNLNLADDSRVDSSLLTIGDGVTLVRKKWENRGQESCPRSGEFVLARMTQWK